MQNAKGNIEHTHTKTNREMNIVDVLLTGAATAALIYLLK